MKRVKLNLSKFASILSDNINWMCYDTRALGRHFYNFSLILKGSHVMEELSLSNLASLPHCYTIKIIFYPSERVIYLFLALKVKNLNWFKQLKSRCEEQMLLLGLALRRYLLLLGLAFRRYLLLSKL